MPRLARSCYRHRRIVLGGWVVLLVGLMALASAAGGVFKVDFSLPGSESERAFDILKERGFGDRTGEQGQIVFSATQGVDDPRVKAAMGGDIFAAEAFGSSEEIGLLLAVIILLVAFGSVLAAGLPIATALVLVDATIVRLILVPATKWLDRVLPVVHVEAHGDDPDAELAELTRQEAAARR